MASKADFTDSEWLALRKGAMGSAMLVSMSDRDFTDTFGEAGAMARFLNENKMTGSTPLIRDLSNEGNPFGITTPPERLRDETMLGLRSAVTILTEKFSEDLEPYRQFVVDLAEAVANAKSGRSDVERKMIDQIREAVGP